MYEQQQLGFSYRMKDIQAVLGLSQLQRLDEMVAERNRQLLRYRELLAYLPVKLLEVPDDVLSSVHLAVIRLQQANAEQHRQAFDGLRAAGIGVQLQPYYCRLGFREGDFPEAEAYASDVISLPLYPGLQNGDQPRVVRPLASLLAA